MYPFLSHELVFIIGCIYVVKLCGKVAVADSSCCLFQFCFFFWLFRFILFLWHYTAKTRDNLTHCSALSLEMCSSVYGKFLAFVTTIKCSNCISNSSGLLFFFATCTSTSDWPLFSVSIQIHRFGAMNTRLPCTCIEFNT